MSQGHDHSHASSAAGHGTGKTVRFKVKRQDDANSPSYYQEFEVPYQDGMNVISLLMEVQKHPQTASGEQTTAVNWECACLEEVCGSCTMVINGHVRQSCSAIVDQLEQPIVLEPMTKFPVIRDLQVNRQPMFEALKRVKGWIPIDGTYDLGPGPRQSDKDQHTTYTLSTCMTCGCCVEACPNYNEKTGFIGAAAISQARLFNMHPTGERNKDERLEALLGHGGIAACGNAQNCVQVCPKEIPLTESIAKMGRETLLYEIRRWFGS